MAAGEGRFSFWPKTLSLQSIRGRMALLLGMAMLPAGAIAMQVGLNAVSVRQAAYEESLGRRALQSISLEKGVIEQVRALLRAMATSPDIQRAQVGDCTRWLAGVAAQYEYVASIGLTNTDGRILCSVPAAVGQRARDSAVRTTAVARDDFTIGYIDRPLLTDGPVLGAMQPVKDAQGHRVGFVGLSVRTDYLHRVLDQTHAANGARLAIVDGQGRVVAQSSATPNTIQPDLPTAAQVRRHIGSDPAFVTVRNGDAVVVPLSAPDIYLVMSWAPDQPAWRRWGSIAASVAGPILIWILAVAAGWFAIEIYVARPLSALESAARGFARGEDVHEPPSLTDAPIEIRSLRRTMAAMAKTLRGRETRLVEALHEERALLKEVHHRVKNNLQMVASLLSIQGRAAKDESEAWGLARAHDRIQLLSLVHQRIYSSGEVRELRVDELAADIARQLTQARGAQAQKIVLSLDLAPARAEADRALPLAFMIGEGVQAALDALSESAGAELRLSLRQDPDGELRIALDGDPAVTSTTPATATRLIDAFARQLGASMGRAPERSFAMWIKVPPPAGEAQQPAEGSISAPQVNA